MAAGLQRQLARTDLPAPARARLTDAQTQLWQVIRAADAVRTSELWSWSYADGRYRVEPFGAQGAHEDESNAAQLWSTVFLALSPPVTAPAPDKEGKSP
jgi:lysozyme family protein